MHRRRNPAASHDHSREVSHRSPGFRLRVILDLAFPRTDAGAYVQAAIATLIFGIALWRVRHDRDIRTFVIGLATLTFAWFALRTLH